MGSEERLSSDQQFCHSNIGSHRLSYRRATPVDARLSEPPPARRAPRNHPRPWTGGINLRFFGLADCMCPDGQNLAIVLEPQVAAPGAQLGSVDRHTFPALCLLPSPAGRPSELGVRGQSKSGVCISCEEGSFLASQADAASAPHACMCIHLRNLRAPPKRNHAATAHTQSLLRPKVKPPTA